MNALTEKKRMNRLTRWMIKTQIIIGFSVIILAACSSPPEENVTLSAHFIPGDAYHLEMIADQTIQQSFGDMEQRLVQTVGFEYGLSVLGKDDDGANGVEFTYERTRVDQQSGEMAFTFDSQAKTDPVPEQARVFAAMVGKRFTLYVSPKGEISRIAGMEDMLANLVHQLAPEKQPETAEELKYLKENFGAPALRETMKNIWPDLPDHPISVGDTWTSESNSNLGFPLKASQTHQVLNIGKENVEIQINAILSSDENAPPINSFSAKMSYDLAGTRTGTLVISRKTGMVVKSEFSQEFSGSIIVAGDDENMPSMTWPITVKGTNSQHLSPAN